MEKNTDWQEELGIFEQGFRSPFWKLISSRGDELLKIAEKDIREMVCENRDYLAGKLVGIESILKYPDQRIRNLKQMLKPGQD